MSDLERYLKDDSVPNGWWMEPIMGAATFIADETMFGGVTKRAVGALTLASMSLPLVSTHPDLKATTQQQEAYHRLAKEYEGAAKLVKDMGLDKDEFDRLNKHSLVAIWNVFEAGLEDLLISLLVNDPNAYEKLSTVNSKIKAEMFPVKDVDSATNLIRRLKAPFQASNMSFISIYEGIFECFGISLKSSIEDCSKIEEVKQTRNCIVHRKSYVDYKATQKSPSLKKWENKVLLLPEALYQEYHSLLGNYLVRVYQGILPTQYCYIKPST